jgi:hypothetical protein
MTVSDKTSEIFEVICVGTLRGQVPTHRFRILCLLGSTRDQEPVESREDQMVAVNISFD